MGVTPSYCFSEGPWDRAQLKVWLELGTPVGRLAGRGAAERSSTKKKHQAGPRDRLHDRALLLWRLNSRSTATNRARAEVREVREVREGLAGSAQVSARRRTDELNHDRSRAQPRCSACKSQEGQLLSARIRLIVGLGSGNGRGGTSTTTMLGSLHHWPEDLAIAELGSGLVMSPGRAGK